MPEAPDSAQVTPRYAGLGPRFLALTIDFILLSLVFFPVTRLVKGVWLMQAADHEWSYGWLVTDPLCLLFLAVIVLYFVILEGTAGATLGKHIMRLKVVQHDGSKAGLPKSVLRNIARAIDALPAFNILGIILIIRSPERARVGDRIAGTRVIHTA